MKKTWLKATGQTSCGLAMQFDATLRDIVQELTRKYRCHTIILYASRAKGQTTPTSDYDVIGVRKDGKKTRIAKKQDSKFWDVSIYAEKDLRMLDDQHLSYRARMNEEEISL